MIWDEQAIERMRHLASLRYTARQISEELGCSRNSIIGKCRRVGIMLLSANTGKARPPRGPRIRARVAPNFMLKPRPMPKQHRERACILPEALMPCDNFHLDDTTCHWPLWGMHRPELKDQFYCGAVALTGSSWCKEHFIASCRPVINRSAPANYVAKRSVIVA